MDLIYTDENRVDIGVLKDSKLDLAYGSSENNFELTVNTSNHVCREDYYIYVENTEYGGIVDSINVNTEDKKIIYKGRTFHGILSKKIISPNSGDDYYYVSGDANAVLGSLITRHGLATLFSASEDTSVNINNYRFSRYTDLYTGIKSMLESVGYKLEMAYTGGAVKLSAVPISVYGEDDGLDSDDIGFNIQKTFNPVNHLICLGQGTLKNRTVLHLYLDAEGKVSNTQYYTGIQEVVEVYDYPNVESAEELSQKGKEYLLSQDTNGTDVTVRGNKEYDIGDIINATENVTGIKVMRTVTKKIVTISGDKLKIDYKVGE